MSRASSYRAGIIGCGLIAGGHARGYEEVPTVELVAGADRSKPQGAKFIRRFPSMTMYTDYREMLAKEQLDLVSVCTWPPLHEEMVVAAAESGLKGILCEKPVAVSLGQMDRMLAACEAHGVKFIVGHQRRYNRRYQEAKAALERGEIGEMLEIQGQCGGDLLTDGTHNIDLVRYFLNDEPIAWVMGQIERQAWGTFGKETIRYGHQIEQAAFGRFGFANGVRGSIETGAVAPRVYQQINLFGTEGRIEVYGDRHGEDRLSGWRIWRKGQTDWEEHLIEQEVNGFSIEIAELVRWIEEGGDHLLKGESARADLEVLMAVYESVRRRGRVELPLDVDENPLEAMVEAGEI